MFNKDWKIWKLSKNPIFLGQRFILTFLNWKNLISPATQGWCDNIVQ